MAGRPNPAGAARIFVPMPGNPGGIDARARFPMAGDPNPMIVRVLPISVDPYVRGIGCGAFHFGARRRRRFVHHDGASRAGGCHGFIRGYNHGLMVRDASAEEHPCDYRQYAKYCFFHSFL